MDKTMNVRLKQIRLAKGYSLDELVAKSGGIVTKQAISKYEQGKIYPSAMVLTRLAQALGVKVATLTSSPTIQVEMVGYRKHSALPKKEISRVENLVKQCLEERIHLQEMAPDEEGGVPIRKWRVKTLKDAEVAAEELRDEWSLGRDPIGSAVGVLENHRVHVFEIDAHEKFDGLAAIARNTASAKEAVGAAVVIRRMSTGERQRLDVAHELGHLVLDPAEGIDEEKAAFRFGAAFLAPRETVLKEVGAHRTAIGLPELLLLKKRFGMSIQALLYRLVDLEIINRPHYLQWCKSISKQSWRKKEPESLPKEKPEWFRQRALRAFAEGNLSHEEVETMLGEKVENHEPLTLVHRRSFMKLPIEERRRLMIEQANKIAAHYEENPDWRELGGGDFV